MKGMCHEGEYGRHVDLYTVHIASQTDGDNWVDAPGPSHCRCGAIQWCLYKCMLCGGLLLQDTNPLFSSLGLTVYFVFGSLILDCTPLWLNQTDSLHTASENRVIVRGKWKKDTYTWLKVGWAELLNFPLKLSFSQNEVFNMLHKHCIKAPL